MGCVFDLGVGLDTKMSPRRVAITKAQKELRLEYDVREERRRELSFLEQGGNPLDFKFGRVASISLQSTSLTDQLAEYEAKGSFALAASPHGDSVESSGRPGVSTGKDPNIADNLLLFDREKSNPGRKKYIKRTGRRSNVTPLELSSQVDDHRKKKDSDDSVIFRLRAKGQAYARRNRLRPNRDTHSNKYPTLPSSCDDARDVKESQGGVHDEMHVVSSISNSKPATSKDTTKAGGQGATTRTEKLQVVECNATPVEQATNDSATQPSQLIGKDAGASVGFLSTLPEAIENIKGVSLDEKANGYGGSDADMTNLRNNDMNAKKYVSGHLSEVVGTRNINTSPAYIRTCCHNVIADSDDSLALRAGGSLDRDSKEQVACQGHSVDRRDRDKSQFTDSAVPIASNYKATSLPTSFNNQVIQNKHETIICGRADDQGEKRQFSNTAIVKDRKSGNSLGGSQEINNSVVVTSGSFGLSHDPYATISKKVSSTASELQSSEAGQLKFGKKAHEDAILEEAWIIEATLKRAGTLSKSCISSEKRHKCHWDFVLEEMSWMANDFIQERVWKATAAAQVSRWIASFGRSKFEQRHMCREQRNITRTLAKAVVQFWLSAKAIHLRGESPTNMNDDCKTDSLKLSTINNLYTWKDQGVENCGRFVQQGSRRFVQQGIQSYALRFLQYISNMSNDPVLVESPSTPDRITATSTWEISSDDLLSAEEFLFYEVPPGAMHSYRESVQSQCVHNKRKGIAMNQQDCEAFMCSSVRDGSRGSVFEEDEGETGTDILQGAFEGNFSFKITNNKMKKMQKKYPQRLYEVGADFSYGTCPDRKFVNHSLSTMGKRPSSILNVGSVRTKRMRTTARQRIVSPFGARVTGALQVTSRTDVSSGDTYSFQDDQSSLHGGSQPWKNLEVESTVDSDMGLPYDGSEISTKPKKKRKPKHLGYKNSLNLPDSAVLFVPGKSDLMIKQFEVQPFESKGNIGFYGQHAAKKSKFTKNMESQEHSTLAGGPMPTPVASQTSYMPNSNKLIRIMNSRGRQIKAMKVAAGQSGSGIPWSTFEDQALVVLVHDMGLNWELVSDALNSTLQFKYIYRKPKDCKERHKFLMDRSNGDGVDSAEDSGSSQPYPSTLPGIPKGSARQLFQRLHGPMEEDTLKSHFGKIILIGQHLHSCRTQNDNQELKQLTPVHSSHGFALSQACPNNLSGPILSPLDLCDDDVNLSPHVSGLGYQGSYANGITLPGHQGSLAPGLPTSNAKTLLHGSPSMILGNGLPSPFPSVKTPQRDVQRYAVPRSTTLLVDDQQRLQNYNQILPGRNMQQSGMSVPGSSPAGVDRGVRMLHGANGMGMMCGVNRSMPMPRPGFQGITPSGMLNMVSRNNMLPVSSVGMPNPVSVHTNSVPGPGNSTFRPHDSLQMVRPGQSTEDHRQITVPEIQIQVSQGNAQAATNFNDMSASFSNAMVSRPVKTSPVQQHQLHQIPRMPGNPHHPHNQGSNQPSIPHQAYIRFAKERQLQQIMTPQVQHPYSGSTTTSPMQSIPQSQQQNQTSPLNSMSSSQSQHKQQPSVRNPQSSGTISSQNMKQKQRQQVEQQQPRNVQQQKQQVQLQAQQQAKHMNSLGQGSMLVHQNLPVDGSHVGGLPTPSRNQASEKHLMQQSQGFFSGSAGLNPNLPQPSNKQKVFSRPHTQSSKQVPMMSSHSDSNQASIQVSPSHALEASQQSAASSISLAMQQQELQHRLANQSPVNMHRMTLLQDPHLNTTDKRIQSTNDLVQIKKMIPVTSVPQTSDPTSPPAVLSSGTHWKQDPSMEKSTSAPIAQLAGSPQENHTGNNAVIIPSSHGLVQRQLSGNVSIRGHVTGGQWQQQQLLHSQPQSPLPPQQQNQHGSQGNLYTWPLNSRPG